MPSLDNAICLVTLEELIARAKRNGMYGVAIVNQSSYPEAPAYQSLCLSKSAAVCSPRSWYECPTLEGALNALATAMDGEWGIGS